MVVIGDGHDGWPAFAFDLAIAAAYFSIPTQLAYFVWQAKVQTVGGRSVQFQAVLGLYASFILLCGLSHLLMSLNLGTALVVVKGLTAGVSWLTALVSFWIIPAFIQTAMRLDQELAVFSSNTTKAVKERQQLLKAKQEIEVFMNFVCHEIRNPLQIITANSEFLFETTLTPEQSELVTALSASSHMMVSIVNDVLDLSRLDAGRLTPEITDFDLTELIHGLVKNKSGEAHAKRLDLIATIDTNVPRRVRSDARRLYQVLLNLLSNAVKYSDAGTITISVRAVETLNPKTTVIAPSGSLNAAAGVKPQIADSYSGHLYIDDNSPTGPPLLPKAVVHASAANGLIPLVIEFALIDTGQGIDRPLLAQLFQPFTQGTETATGQGLYVKQAGSGLGLSIVRRLVTLLGGTITVPSQLKRGSIFALRFPFERCEFPVSPLVTGRGGAVETKSPHTTAHQMFSYASVSLTAPNPAGPTGAVETKSHHPSAPSSSRANVAHHMPSVSSLTTANPPGTLSPTAVAADLPGTPLSNTPIAGSGSRTPIHAGAPTLRRLENSRIALLVAAATNRIESNVYVAPHSTQPPSDVELSTIATPESANRLVSAAVANSVPLTGTHRPRVLVVDDRDENRRVLTRMIIGYGFDVDTANDGQQAINRVRDALPIPPPVTDVTAASAVLAPPTAFGPRSTQYAMILMDIQMPVKDGMQATREIRALGVDTPIIAMSGSSRPSERDECLAIGMTEYQTKPVSRSQITGLLAKYGNSTTNSRHVKPITPISTGAAAPLVAPTPSVALHPFSVGVASAAPAAPL